MMSNAVFEIVRLLVMLCAALVAAFVIPWIRARMSKDTLETVEEWVEAAVLMAQQTMWDKDGADRKKFVLDYISRFCNGHGISLTAEQVDILIESAVKEMKLGGREKA
ncbi:Bacteriophage holin of superfamily 6 (Holin_LLH) [Lachnospiraceae bacterium NK3A20]|nr:Bacteriophage holin of superfamily 6 (Holin_LLH) [Lachnospiraceae bacterium NK3A20]